MEFRNLINFKNGNPFENALNLIYGYLGDINFKKNRNIFPSNNMEIKKVSLVEIFKEKFEIEGCNDEQIEEALIKAKGNFGEAIDILYGE